MTITPVAAPQGVRTAIAEAAERTGVDFSYLVATAQRESGFDPNARARTSSAAGLFQFVEQTWLGMVKRHGAEHGLGAQAAQIERGADGRYRVADPEARRQILDLRFDANAASAMAGEYAAESADLLSSRLGRQPAPAELYAAHFLGPAGAARLIEAAQTQPDTRADALFPAAARANRSIFQVDGQPATVAQVLANLGAKHGGGAAAAPALRRDDTPVPEAFIRNFASAPGPRVLDIGGWNAEDMVAREAMAFAPSRGGGARVLSPLVIEALAALDTPGRARDKRSA